MAAGRAGAAARKAKHEKLLAQLREVKDNIREPVIDGVSKATDAGRVPAAQASSASLQVVDTTGHLESAGAAKTGTMTDWTPWVAGGIGLAGFAWFLRERSRTVTVASQLPQPRPARLATLTPSMTAKPQVLAAKPTISAAKQLKTDPFYME